jgi:uncharacterized membrane protein YjjB (DUF3815 family)
MTMLVFMTAGVWLGPKPIWSDTMTVDLLPMLRPAICGGLAAAGFAVLFNVRFRGLPSCFASGALALALRTIAVEKGSRLEVASFAAALLVGLVLGSDKALVPAVENSLRVVFTMGALGTGLAITILLLRTRSDNDCP